MKTWDGITDKRIETLHPLIRDNVTNFINEVHRQLLILLRITQALRTINEQSELFGRPTDGKDNDNDGKIDEPDEKVTNAPGGTSYHNFGLAFDVCEIIYRGKKAIANFSPDWNQIVPIAKKYGFEWGGYFKTFKDKPHFQRPFHLSTEQLIKLPKDGIYPIIPKANQN
jgi:peptidoglycan L-alanyl-D-glutamate endopeptidase CwlK